jgi:peptidoglycan/LPS O-acetylase OafA/YrhL
VSERLHSLDWVRAFAALVVVLYHAEAAAHLYLPAAQASGHWFAIGWIGVPVFFVLSGYVIPHALRQRQRSAGQFLLARLWRLYPTYLVLSLLLIGLLWLLQRLLPGAEPLAAAKLLDSLAFGWGHNDRLYLYVGWTLFWESLFYLAVAAALALDRQRRARPAAALGLFVAAGAGVWLLQLLGAPGAAQALVYIASFLAGLATWSLELPPRPAPARMLAYGLGLLLLLLNPRDPPFGLAASLAALLIGAGVRLERHQPGRFRWAPVIGLGTISYSLYLVQVITVPLAIRPLAGWLRTNQLPFATAKQLLILAALACTIAAAWLSWRLLERQLSGRLAAAFTPRSPARRHG